MRFLYWMRGPLMEAAGEGAGGGGGSGAGAGAGDGKSGNGFDAATFKTELMGEVNKAVNGAVGGLKKDFQKLLQQVKAGDGAGDGSGAGGDGSGDGSGDGAGAGKDKPDAKTKQLETRLKTLETQLADEKKAREGEKTARRNAERDSSVQKVLAGFQFADEEAGRDAFDLVAPKLKWNDDGLLVGPDGETSAEDWIKATVAKKTHLLAPKTTGGAGARGGTAAGGGSRKWDLERDLVPENFAKLKPEEKAELRRFAASQLGIAV